jgi:cytochrome b561
MDESAAVWPLSLRLIHWVSAALVLGALGCGVSMVELVHDPAERFELTQTHKSIGIAVLALTLARLCLRILATAPKPEPAAPLLLAAAKTAHIALYALLVAMPLSGWLMATTTPVRVPTFVFGLFELPYPLAPALPTYQFAHALHFASAIALASLTALHVAAALVHALLWRDRTVARIWRKQRSARRGRADEVIE